MKTKPKLDGRVNLSDSFPSGMCKNWIRQDPQKFLDDEAILNGIMERATDIYFKNNTASWFEQYHVELKPHGNYFIALSIDDSGKPYVVDHDSDHLRLMADVSDLLPALKCGAS